MSKKKIPPQAKCVFQGEIFEVWQWEQKMYDGTTATFEKLKRPDTVEVIATVGEKILIIEEEQPDSVRPYLALPGGRVEKGERSLAAAQRELLEELGYVSKDWELWNEQQPVGKIDWTISVYIARNCVPQQVPHLDPGEKITILPISFEEFLALANEPRFHDRDLKLDLLRARFDSSARVRLHQLFFGQ